MKELIKKYIIENHNQLSVGFAIGITVAHVLGVIKDTIMQILLIFN